MAEDMKRTKPVNNVSADQLQAMQELIGWARAGMTRVLRGSQYSGARDIYEALGYKKEVEFEDFYTQYTRQDIAAAVINRPVSATWRGPVTVLESDDDETTALEQAWLDLENELKLKEKFVRLDKLAGLGRYAVLFLGLNDVKNSTELTKPVTISNGLKLLYVRPLSEANASIFSWENDPTNERYGFPKMYKLRISSPGTKDVRELQVHYSRILHVAEGLLEGNLLGQSRLEPVFNRLKDLEKLVGGSAEMFWRGARPGYHGNIDPEARMSEEDKDKLRIQLDEYDHNLRRFLVGSGINIQELASQVVDPSNHVDVQIQMISAATGIPKRILTGSERGELASTQDKDNWLSFVLSRRQEFVEPTILRPFIDLLIKYKVLPEPAKDKSYCIAWEDLWSVNDKEKAEVGKIRVDALKAYASDPGTMQMLPPDMFYKLIMGLSEEEIELINQYQDQMMKEAEDLALSEEEEDELIDEENEEEEEDVDADE